MKSFSVDKRAWLSAPDDLQARRLVITGRVQGVGFRYHMTQVAHQLNLYGWVRNRRDSSVEAHIEGMPEFIAAMIDWARTGPSAACVAQVVVEQIETGTLHDLETFQQRETV